LTKKGGAGLIFEGKNRRDHGEGPFLRGEKEAGLNKQTKKKSRLNANGPGKGKDPLTEFSGPRALFCFKKGGGEVPSGEGEKKKKKTSNREEK